MVGWIILLVLVLLLILLVGTAILSYRVKFWPSVEGKIILHRIEETYDQETGSRTFFPKVQYEYFINSRRYTSDNIAFRIEHHYQNISEAKAWIAEYQVGQAVTVHYNSLLPHIAVLQINVHSHLLFWMIGLIGVITASFSWWLFLS